MNKNNITKETRIKIATEISVFLLPVLLQQHCYKEENARKQVCMGYAFSEESIQASFSTTQLNHTQEEVTTTSGTQSEYGKLIENL
ncbi:hypothetical protein GF360_03175 [candidate division WWE3 bacterium]|nr:hypothetical protein [candidate division WWE3 bacterium]